MKIVYKIVAAILALIVIPLAIFGPVMYYSIKSTAMQMLLLIVRKTDPQILDNYMNAGSEIPDTFADTLSLYKSFDLLDIAKSLSENNTTNPDIDIIKTPAITAGVLFILILICALVTAILAIVCKNNRKPVFGALVGIGLSVVFKFAFESLAAPFVDGTVSLSSFMSNSLLAGLIAEVQTFTLSTTYWLIPICFAAVAVWTLLYNITLPESEKIERKRMLGEYEE